jgi:heavy metal sensor kinase
MRLVLGSVRWRLTIWYSLSIALTYFLFSSCVFWMFRFGCIAQSHMQLDNEFSLVANAVAKAPGQLKAIEDSTPVRNFYVLYDHSPLYISSGWARAGIPSAMPTDPNGYGFGAAQTGRHYIVRKSNVWLAGRMLQIGVAQDSQQTFDNLNKLLFVLLVSLPGILLVSLGGGYFLAGRVLSPIDEMARKAKEITADNLSQRLTVSRQDDEFAHLATVFNQTFDQLEDSFRRLKQFTADASHELRTPLAVIRSLGENALQRPSEMVCYQDAIGSILEETDRLTRLLDGLLTLTRAESEQFPLHFDRLDLGELSLDVINCLRVLAEEKEQTLMFDEQAGVKVEADKSTIKQALINLVANAIQYTQTGGEIRVCIRHCAQRGALVEVEDNGPGIALEHREKVFERFYRVEKDRSQETGGSGLGLAIARWAIGLNGGSIEFEAKQAKGSIFRIILPAA